MFEIHDISSIQKNTMLGDSYRNYDFILNQNQIESLNNISKFLNNKNYIDLKQNDLYLHFIVSDWFIHLNLNNQSEILSYIDKIDFILENYINTQFENDLIDIKADCFLHIKNEDEWFKIKKSQSPIYPNGGPVEIASYINYHSYMNIDLEPLDLMRLFKYRINKKIYNHDPQKLQEILSENFKKEKLNLFEDYKHEIIYHNKNKNNYSKNYHYLTYYKRQNFIYHQNNYQKINKEYFDITTNHFEYYFGNNPYDKNHWKKTHEKYNNFFRKCENQFRESIGFKNVGESWVSETNLYLQIKNHYKNLEIIQHGKPKFLNKQHYDIWIPQLKIAIEYHGEQHFKPIKHFGGEKTFIKTKERDNNKINLSIQNNVQLIIVEKNYNLDQIFEQIDIAIQNI